MGSIDLENVPVGIDLETGGFAKIKAVESNLLVGGSTRSGKSAFANSLIATFATIEDCALVLIDPKRTEFRRFLPRASAYANTQQGADALLKAIEGEMMARYEYLEAEGGSTKIRDFKKHPFIAVFIDELSFLLNGDDKALNASVLKSLTNLLTLEAAAGISVIALTQKPSGDALKSTTFRDNFIQKLAFRCATPEATKTILSSALSKTCPADELPANAKGIGYLSSEAMEKPCLFKSFYITEEEAAQAAQRYSHLRIPLPFIEPEQKERKE